MMFVLAVAGDNFIYLALIWTGDSSLLLSAGCFGTLLFSDCFPFVTVLLASFQNLLGYFLVSLICTFSPECNQHCSCSQTKTPKWWGLLFLWETPLYVFHRLHSLKIFSLWSEYSLALYKMFQRKNATSPSSCDSQLVRPWWWFAV